MARPRSIWRVLVPAVTVLAGVLFSTSALASSGSDLRGERGSLADVIRARTYAVETRSRAVDAAQAQVDALGRRQRSSDPALAAEVARGDAVALAAGDTPVTGPAVRVELSDAPPGRIPEGYTVDDVVVHQQDVQAVVNALWSAGAEAMTIQDQRIVSTSAVRCVGNTLILQGRVYSPPYVITAVGDQRAMREALDLAPGVAAIRDYVTRVGLVYRVSDVAQARLPAYSGSLDLRAAHVAG